MKRDVPFVLEEASWPAFLVEPSGTILRSNPAALRAFGSALHNGSALSNIWAKENQTPAEDFLKTVAGASSGAASLRFRLEDNAAAGFVVYVSRVVRDGENYFVFQLFSHEGGETSGALPAFVEQTTPPAPPQTEIIFALENAEWPALWIERTGAIHRANEAAVNTFGSNLRGSEAKLALLWAPENRVTADKFLQQLAQPSHKVPLAALRLKDGTHEAFAITASPLSHDQHDYLLLQLLKPSSFQPATAPQPSPPPASAPASIPATEAPAGSGVAPPASSLSMDANVAHKQKLDCALQLARTVALDFNNALTSILGHASLLIGKSEADHPWRSSLVEIEKSASKAAEIANDLAAFSRQDRETAVQSAGNLNAVLQRAVDLFRKPETAHIAWTFQPERKLFGALFDEAKLQQAFVKVIENAVQASDAGGEITVQTRNAEILEPMQDCTAKINPGVYVCIEVTDHGTGIETDLLPRVFEPFFTTKQPPHRGLGLAWVYGIVTNHGGSVAIFSKPKNGASVRIYLPAQKKILKDVSVSTGDLHGSQTVLIVDDEDLLLTMGQMVLSSFGYEVLIANSGPKALELFASGKSIDLVVTDMVMPNMSGRELIERIRKIAPDIKIICSSGIVRSDDELSLQKPFTSQDLLRKVKQALATEA